MTRIDDPTAEVPVPPGCRATVDRLQLVLDGDLGSAALDADPHPAVCAACRERIAAARVLLSVLAAPEPVPLPTGLTDAILGSVREDRAARIRRRTYAIAVAACAALVASGVVLAWLTSSPPQPIVPLSPHNPDVAAGKPNTEPEPEPAPRPVRIGDELAKAGAALRGSS